MRGCVTYVVLIGLLSLSLWLPAPKPVLGAEEPAAEVPPAAEPDAPQARERLVRQRGMADRGRQARTQSQRGATTERLQMINAVDAVRLALASVYVEKQRTADAIKILEEVAGGEDADAAGFARLELAAIYRQQGEDEKARALLAEVRGPAAVLAADMMIELAGGGPEKIEELLASAADPLAKAVLLRRLTAVWLRTGDTEKLVELAARAEKLVSREDAVKALEVERLVRSGTGPVAELARGVQGMTEQWRDRRTQMEEEAKELEANGQNEEAARIRERLDRMNRFENMLRGDPGAAPPAGGMRGRNRNRNPEAIPGGNEGEQF